MEGTWIMSEILGPLKQWMAPGPNTIFVLQPLPSGQILRNTTLVLQPFPSGQILGNTTLVLHPLPSGQILGNTTLVLQPLPSGQILGNTTLVLQPLPSGQILGNTTLVLQPLPSGQILGNTTLVLQPTYACPAQRDQFGKRKRKKPQRDEKSLRARSSTAWRATWEEKPAVLLQNAKACPASTSGETDSGPHRTLHRKFNMLITGSIICNTFKITPSPNLGLQMTFQMFNREFNVNRDGRMWMSSAGGQWETQIGDANVGRVWVKDRLGAVGVNGYVLSCAGQAK